MAIVKCSVGNKKCGKRCVPQEHNCKDDLDLMEEEMEEQEQIQDLLDQFDASGKKSHTLEGDDAMLDKLRGHVKHRRGLNIERKNKKEIVIFRD
jgi:hypothetical protein